MKNKKKHLLLLAALSFGTFLARAQFTGSSGSTYLVNSTDNVGIGTGSPAYKLDVDGDLNLSLDKSYLISGFQVLQYNNGLNNLFLGSNISSTYNFNTNNIIMGSTTGQSLANSNYNFMAGYDVANAATLSNTSIVIGYKTAELKSDIGGSNIFMGSGAARGSGSGGTHNIILGTLAGSTNGNDGDNNVMIGRMAGYFNQTGSNNVFIGYAAFGGTNLQNAIAIGYNALVTTNNSMVLGNGVNVGIGISAPSHKLHVVGDGYMDKLTIGGPGVSFSAPLQVDALVADQYPAAATFTNHNAGGLLSFWALGAHGESRNHYLENTGVQGMASGPCTAVAYGVRGDARNTMENYGVFGSTTSEFACDAGSLNVGVYGRANTPAYGHTYAGYFDGDLAYTGALIHISDAKFKENIQQLDNSIIDKIMLLAPSTYTFKKTDAYKHIGFREGMEYGFIAQELEKVFPECVKNMRHPAQRDMQTHKVINPATDYKGIDYTLLIPVLTAGIQVQQNTLQQHRSEIDELAKERDDLKNRLTDLEQQVAELQQMMSGNKGSSYNSSSAPKDIARIGQNNPNPFKGVAVISYFIPAATQRAVITIYNDGGVVVRTFHIQNRNAGELSVQSDEMGTGTFFYEMVLDGRKIDVKKMLILK